MRKFNIADARLNLAEIVNDVAYRGERAVVMRRGRAMAALVPMADLELLRSIPLAVPVLTPVEQKAQVFTLTVPIYGETREERT